MNAIKLETMIEEDGIVRVPELKAGERVEVIVLRHSEHESLGNTHFGGWLRGRIKMLSDFDDPIPGMEEYA